VVGLSKYTQSSHQFIKKRLSAFKGDTKKAERNGNSNANCIHVGQKTKHFSQSAGATARCGLDEAVSNKQ
jgi:hypothetical protein